MKTEKLFDRIYSFIERYFYFIIGSIVFALASLTASLYAQDFEYKTPFDSSTDYIESFKSDNNQDKAIKKESIKSSNIETENTNSGITIDIKESEKRPTEHQQFFIISEFVKQEENTSRATNLGYMNFSYSNWSKIAKRYKMEVRSARPKLT